MAISVTNLGIGTDSGATQDSNLTATVPAGALIVVGTAETSTGTSGTVSDGTNTYTSLSKVNYNNVAGNGHAELFYKANCAAITSAFLNYAHAGTGFAQMSAFYATGVATASPVDTAATATAFGSSTSRSITSGTPASAGDLFVGFVGAASNTGTLTAASSPWSATPGAGRAGTNTIASAVYLQNQVVAGSTAQTYTVTNSTSSTWAGMVVAFKSAAGTAYSLPGVTAAYTYGTFAAGAAFNRKLPGVTSSYLYTGLAATPSFARKLPGATAGYLVAGQAAVPRFNRKTIGVTGAYAYSGQSAGAAFNRKVPGVTGAYAFSGQAAVPAFKRKLLGTTGSYAYTGFAAGLQDVPPGVHYFLNGTAGAYLFSGKAAVPSYARKLPGTTGPFVFTGRAAGLVRDRPMSGTTGAYAFTGKPGATAFFRRLPGTTGAYAVTGNTASIIRAFPTPNPWALLVGA